MRKGDLWLPGDSGCWAGRDWREGLQRGHEKTLRERDNVCYLDCDDDFTAMLYISRNLSSCELTAYTILYVNFASMKLFVFLLYLLN